jgi:hypothetical protein
MTSFRESFFAQRSARISAALVLCFMLLAACPIPSAAQGASARNALRLLGKFAVNVATSVATSIASDEVKAAIHHGENTPGDAASQIARKTGPPVSGYTFTLTWRSDDGIYSGRLVMEGVTGYFHVSTPDATWIDQDMHAVSHHGAIYIIGSNPRYAGSTIPAYYSADNFLLTQLSDGEWSIASTCDSQGKYAPVAVVEANTF